MVRLRDIVAGRHASGAASRYDLTRIEIELGGLRAKQEQAKAEVSDRAGTLAALLGLPDWRPRATGVFAPLALGPDAFARSRDRAMTSPAVVAAKREEEAARGGIEVARRERVPVPSVSIGRSWTSDPFGAANFLGLSVEIPILDTKRGPLARAEAEAQAAALRRFDEEAAKRLPGLRQMAEDAYRLGRGSILELFDAVRSRHELQQTRVELVGALLEAQIRYLAITGELEQSVGLSARSLP